MMTARRGPHRTKLFAGDYAPSEVAAGALPGLDEIVDVYWAGICASQPDWQLRARDDVTLSNGAVGRRLSGVIYYFPDRSHSDRSLRPRRLLVGAVRNGCLSVDVVAWHGISGGPAHHPGPPVLLNVAFNDDLEFYLPNAELLTIAGLMGAETRAAELIGVPDPIHGLRRFTMMEGHWIYPEYRYT